MASFLFSAATPLLFSWLLPLIVCHIVWLKKAPEKPSKWFLTALWPVMFIGLFVGEYVARTIRPDFYADRGDNPSQIAELMFAMMLCWTYIPIIKRLAEMKQPGYKRKKIDLAWFLRLIEFIFWIPISIGLFIAASITIGLMVTGISKLGDFDYGMLLGYLIPFVFVLMYLGIKKWRKSLEKANKLS